MLTPLAKLCRTWRQRRQPITAPAWMETLAKTQWAGRYDLEDRDRLRILASRFLREKSLEPAGGMLLETGQRILIAAHACVPILNLGLDWYRGWHAVVVYPSTFVPYRTHVDAAGVVHRSARALSGESWQRGPVIVSWEDIVGAEPERPHNVIIHEMVHKLDMLNGIANGRPPLHAEMDVRAWTDALTREFHNLRAKLQAGLQVQLDPYAATSPAEFFAVASELFFEAPETLYLCCPGTYAQLALFYRQDLADKIAGPLP